MAHHDRWCIAATLPKLGTKRTCLDCYDRSGDEAPGAVRLAVAGAIAADYAISRFARWCSCSRERSCS
jgi:hypothetical protein